MWQPVEPLAPVVGDHALERDDVEQDVGGVRGQGQLARVLDCLLRRGDVAGEVGVHAQRDEDLAVIRAPAGGQPVERLGRGRQVPRHHRSPRQAGAQAGHLIRCRQRQRRAVGGHRTRIARRHEGVAAQPEELDALGAGCVIHEGRGPAEHLEVELRCGCAARRL
jgi:hypothetical protein